MASFFSSNGLIEGARAMAAAVSSRVGSVVQCDDASPRRQAEWLRANSNYSSCPIRRRSWIQGSNPDYQNAVRFDTLCRCLQSLEFRVRGGRRAEIPRKRLVVLGTGWGAMNIIQRIDVNKYDVVVVSPRNFFAFTPLLPSAAAGTVTERACLEPVRNKLTRGGKKMMDFYEAWAQDVDDKAKVVICRSSDGKQFSVPYDTLVIAIGAVATTFNTPGVAENALFLKEVEHARAIRKRLLDAFERAALPSASEEERRRLLSFVVIGAGPTGIETAAEIADFLHEEAPIHFPQLVQYATVHVVEMVGRCLPAFQRECSDFTKKNLEAMGVDLNLRHSVVEVTPKDVEVKSLTTGARRRIPAGTVVWASGLANAPLTNTLMNKLPTQDARSLCVDERLRVRGMTDVYAIGDCSVVKPTSVAAAAPELFEKAKSSAMGPCTRWLTANSKSLLYRFPQLRLLDVSGSDPAQPLSLEEFTRILDACDHAWRPPPPTAQNANQEGRYLSAVLNRLGDDKCACPAFVSTWRGAMAYVGNGQAIMESPTAAPKLGGAMGNALWRAFYMTEQMSLTNK